MSKNEQEDIRIVWSTEKVNQTIESMENGYNVTDHPFYDGDQNFKKSNIVFEYTEFEMSEVKRCARDIVYFANTYCQVMTDEGYMKIKCRPYQEKMLETYRDNRQVICMSSRQSGKCSFYDTGITVRNKVTGHTFDITVGKLYDLVNPNKTFIQKFKSYLYKLVSKIE